MSNVTTLKIQHETTLGSEVRTLSMTSISETIVQGGSSTALSDATPAALGTAAPGVGTKASRDDHVHALPSAWDVGADPAGMAATAISMHESSADPHPQYTTTAEAAAAAPVQSVAGRSGAVVLTAADVSDSTATGRAVMTAADAPAARTALDAPSSAQLAAVSDVADAALPKAGGTLTDTLQIVVDKTGTTAPALRLACEKNAGNGTSVEYLRPQASNQNLFGFLTTGNGNAGDGYVGQLPGLVNSIAIFGGDNGLNGMVEVAPTGLRWHNGFGATTPVTVEILHTGEIIPGSFTVAALPLSPRDGTTVYATDGCKAGEAAGAGTGVPVYYSAGKWRVYRDDSEVTA